MLVRELKKNNYVRIIGTYSLFALALLLVFLLNLGFPIVFFQTELKTDYSPHLTQNIVFSHSLKSNLIRRADIRSLSHIHKTAGRQISYYSRSVQTNINHSSIFISGDSDFLNQAALEDWPGSGTLEDPIIISGYNINDDGVENLLEIRNTQLYFKVSNNTFMDYSTVDHKTGIYLYNVINGMIYNNTFQHLHKGIFLVESSHITITNNIVIDYFMGIYLWRYCYHNNLINNTLSDGTCGIDLCAWADHNHLINNTISNSGIGIGLGRASNNTLTTNILVKNREGISLDRESDVNTITNNTIANNEYYGISFNYWPDDYPKNNVVKSNDFLWNNLQGSSQAFDNGTGNLFSRNLWSDWLKFDINTIYVRNGVYPIAGNRNNSDEDPVAIANCQITQYHFSKPAILFPTSDATLEGITEIHWSVAIDFRGYQVFYSIFLSSLSKETWLLLASNLTSTDYTWDTINVNDGNYQIKVVAYFDGGFIQQSISREFRISNYPNSPTSYIDPSSSADNGFLAFNPFNYSLVILLAILGVIILVLAKVQNSYPSPSPKNTSQIPSQPIQGALVPRYCIYCGSPFLSDSIFCTQCGNRIDR
ncbi:MAG: nitrous oxide reductase family maturation protein NosD [Promethearchaeota archaeon]